MIGKDFLKKTQVYYLVQERMFLIYLKVDSFQ